MRAVVERACGGQGGALLIQGDAGVGKTELVAQVLREVDERATVVRGSALPLTSMTVPYLPLRSALARLAVEAGEEPITVFDRAEAADSAPLAFDGWVSARCRDRPLVLAVDDLHWADASTLDALMYVLSGPADRRLAVLLTLRHGEIREGHRLNRWLADVRRLPGFQQMTLGPFDRATTGLQIAGLLGAPPHQSLVDDVFARTEGNAYLTRLLVAGLAPESRSLPATLPGDLKGAVLASWHQLSDPARDLTKVIAIGGRRVSAAELVTFLAGEDLFGDVGGLLREAEAAAVVDQAPDGSYWFHHPLQAQVLAGRVPDEERRSWHARFAAHLEALVDPRARDDVELLVAVADHHHRADHPAQAYAWARRAAAVAGSAGGVREQIRLLRRALELRQYAVPPPPRAQLLLELKDAAVRAGDFENELGTVEELLAETDDESAPLLRAELLLRRGHLRWATGRSFLSLEDVEHALELSSGEPGSWQHAFALAERAHVGSWTEDPRAGEFAERGIAAARRAGHPRALAYALTAGVLIASDEGHINEGLALVEEAREVAVEAEDYYAYIATGFWESILYAPFACRDGTVLLARRRRELQALGGPHPYVAWLAAGEATGWVSLGRWELAAEPLRIALGAAPGGFADIMTRLSAARLAAFQGRIEEALAHLQRADELCGDLSAFPSLEIDVVRSEVLLAVRDPQGALTSALHGASQVHPPSLSERLIPLAARSLAELVEDARARSSDVGPVLDRVDDLVRRFPDVISEKGPTPAYRAQLAACTAWYAAEVGRARRDPDNAAAWEDVVRLAGAADLLWDAAYAGLQAATAHLSAGPGHRQAAAASLRASHRLAEELVARPILDALDELATAARLPVRDIRSDETPPAAYDLPGLTPREREVLAHIVAGHTYTEIAQALVVSEKTVSTHVSNMLHKYGLTNRVELAQLAARPTRPQ